LQKNPSWGLVLDVERAGQAPYPGQSLAAGKAGAASGAGGLTQAQLDVNDSRDAARETIANLWAAYGGNSEDDPTISGLHWIHYLGYARAAAVEPGMADSDTLNTAVVCVPLSHLAGRLKREGENVGFRNNLVDLASVHCYRFIDVLLAAFSPERKTQGWIIVSATVVKAMLPALQDLGQVFIATDRGGDGATPANDASAGALLAPAARPNDNSYDMEGLLDDSNLEDLDQVLRMPGSKGPK
jgi:hypothetical protein